MVVLKNEENDTQAKSKTMSKIHVTDLEINVTDSMKETKNECLK